MSNRVYTFTMSTNETQKPIGPTNAQKIANAATMYGTGSKQHLAAVKRWGK